jgi:hypothetical protein
MNKTYHAAKYALGQFKVSLHTLKIIIPLCLFLLSCTREIDFNPVNVEQELVVNAFIQPGQLDSLLLTSTFSSFTSADFFEGNAIYKGISGANAVVLANDDTVGRYLEAKNKSYYYEGDSFEENKEYQLEIAHPDYPGVSAKTIVPVLPNFWFGTYAENGLKVNTFSTYTPQVLLEFEDDDNSNNYYILSASSTYENAITVGFPEERDSLIIGNEPAQLNSKSPIIEMTYDRSSYDFAQLNYDWETSYGVNRTGIIFSDKIINGQKVSIPIDLQLSELRYTTKIHLTLTAISEEYYQLLRSLATLAKTNDGFFPEALQVYGNVHNGHGLWAAKSSKIITLDISELELFNY